MVSILKSEVSKFSTQNSFGDIAVVEMIAEVGTHKVSNKYNFDMRYFLSN